MSVQITIRNVPESTRETLARRARGLGKSMQEYLLGELERLTRRPTAEEWIERVQKRKAQTGTQVSAETILEARDADRR